jgi:tRNA uridine 5-carboxymethylaminomethyl modification enzyme
VETLLITLDKTKIGEMSCNPSIGGVGKGQLVKEIDALGGEMGITADYTGIQFKRLNTRKGSAVQSTRCQSDKKQYALRMQKIVAEQPHLTVLEAEVKDILVENNKITGLRLQKGNESVNICCQCVVITSGTFMKAIMHCGDMVSAGGRFGEKSSLGLSDNLKALGINILRLKTGTPARLIRESIDFSKMEEQTPDLNPKKFSFWDSEIVLPQVSCYLTYTNREVHGAISSNLDKSPLYSGKILGIGPRYCPSIEDKVVKFPNKDRHPLFFEPEALDSNWIYPNGISTSLPKEVQDAFLRKIPGCENVEVARYGYAVEYDCIDPTQLDKSLELKAISGLFFGGQVNGTSGYEEAAAQGLIAGINAAQKVLEKDRFFLSRTESYIGVMIDDLTSKGVNEPYRMFTSRAEFRLSLREDNADLRLSEKSYKLGLISGAKNAKLALKKAKIDDFRAQIRKTIVKPSEVVQTKLAEMQTAPLTYPQSIYQLIKRPELSLSQALELSDLANSLDSDSLETLEIEIKYEGYIDIQKQEIEKLNKLESFVFPLNVKFEEVSGLSREVREKLSKIRPKTLSEASKVSGVTPSAISALIFHLKKKMGTHADTNPLL